MAAALRPGSPTVSGAAARSVHRVTVLHATGLVSGALVMGLLLALARALAIGAGLRPLLAIPAGVALVAAVLQWVGVPVPQSSWQVPEYWRRSIDAGLLPVAYGAILGFGVFTAVVVGAFWVFAAASFLFSPPVALAGWLAYAGGRTAGFGFALRLRRLERILLSTRTRMGLVVGSTLIAALVVFT